MDNGRVDDEYRLDEIDRRIIHALMVDARDTSAPMIAEDVSVSAATVRNRIANLEDVGIIEGYHAVVNFERAGGSLTNLFVCTVQFGDVERVARRAGAIPGVVNVRELMGGRLNLHVVAVGEDTADLRRIGRDLSRLGAEIEDELLVQEERHFPYEPFGPGKAGQQEPLADFISLSGDAEIAGLPVHENAPIAGTPLERAVDDGLLDEETLVVAIERDDAVVTPHGNTEIRANDVVTVVSPGGVDETVRNAFHAPADETTTTRT